MRVPVLSQPLWVPSYITIIVDIIANNSNSIIITNILLEGGGGSSYV